MTSVALLDRHTALSWRLAVGLWLAVGAHLRWAPAGDPTEHTVLMEQAGRTQNSSLMPPLPLGSGGAELEGRGSKAARPRGGPQAPRGCGQAGQDGPGEGGRALAGPPPALPGPGHPQRRRPPDGAAAPRSTAPAAAPSGRRVQLAGRAPTRVHTHAHSHTHTHSVRAGQDASLRHPSPRGAKP